LINAVSISLFLHLYVVTRHLLYTVYSLHVLLLVRHLRYIYSRTLLIYLHSTVMHGGGRFITAVHKLYSDTCVVHYFVQ